jgi:hypothetical protein
MEAPGLDGTVHGDAPCARCVLDAWLRAEAGDEATLGPPVQRGPAAHGHPAALGDLLGERQWQAALDGVPASIRLGLLTDWWELGCLTITELRSVLPRTWTRSEPDDTDGRWLRLWADASAPGRLELEPLPDGDPLTIFRGESGSVPREPRGIAWSLARDVAVFQALQPPGHQDRSGVLVEGRVPRRAVLGYVTDRGGAAVIVGPGSVHVLANRPVASYEDKADPRATGLGEDGP